MMTTCSRCGDIGYVAERWLRLAPSPVARGESVLAEGRRDIVVPSCCECERGRASYGTPATPEQREGAIALRRSRWHDC